MDATLVNRFKTPINAILALLIGYALAQITLDLLPRHQSSSAVVGNSGNQSQRAVSAEQLASEIASLHLFGRPNSQPVVTAPEPVQQDAPETKLNLTLHGVLAYDPPEHALAIISSGGSKETVYAIGDKVVGNTTLRAVHSDRVIIRRSGKDETLRLPEKVASVGVSTPTATATASAAQGDGLTDLPTSAKELRDRLVKEPSIMADLVVMRPYKRNGQLVGFRIQPKRDPAILRNFGIEPGDVITSVNGIPLTSNREGITALGKLRKATSVDLIVLRGGAEIPISVSLE